MASRMQEYRERSRKRKEMLKVAISPRECNRGRLKNTDILPTWLCTGRLDSPPSSTSGKLLPQDFPAASRPDVVLQQVVNQAQPTHLCSLEARDRREEWQTPVGLETQRLIHAPISLSRFNFRHQHQIWTDWTWQDKVWFVENSWVHGHRVGGQEDEGTRGHRVWPKLKRRRSVHR